MCSDRLVGMREPRLLLKFRLRGADGEIKDRKMELSTSQLESLLAQLGDVQSVIQQFPQQD